MADTPPKELNSVAETEEKESKGATMVEYSLLLLLISIVAIIAVRTMGQQVSANYSDILSSTSDAFRRSWTER